MSAYFDGNLAFADYVDSSIYREFQGAVSSDELLDRITTVLEGMVEDAPGVFDARVYLGDVSSNARNLAIGTIRATAVDGEDMIITFAPNRGVFTDDTPDELVFKADGLARHLDCADDQTPQTGMGR